MFYKLHGENKSFSFWNKKKYFSDSRNIISQSIKRGGRNKKKKMKICFKSIEPWPHCLEGNLDLLVLQLRFHNWNWLKILKRLMPFILIWDSTLVAVCLLNILGLLLSWGGWGVEYQPNSKDWYFSLLGIK